MVEIEINGQVRQIDVPEDTPLLWVLRDTLGMTGTKFGCGVGQCGACTVQLDGVPTRTCVLPVMAVMGRKVRTIEGLDHPVQKAWIEHQVPQCGYCQSGQLMAASALLDRNPRPTDADIDAWMTNLCRCATYARIRKAIHALAAPLPEPAPEAAPAGVQGGE
jgi:isoquinoline 1-oxidoreductase alpha subunit